MMQQVSIGSMIVSISAAATHVHIAVSRTSAGMNCAVTRVKVEWLVVVLSEHKEAVVGKYFPEAVRRRQPLPPSCMKLRRSNDTPLRLHPIYFLRLDSSRHDGIT